MNILVTGAAGFIGSHLCEKLLELGHHVTGADSFVPYYDRSLKEANIQNALQHPHYLFQEMDLRTGDLSKLVINCDAVFHLAAMPGLTQSWVDFESYWTCNVLATKRLLEAIKEHRPQLQRFIQASTSSVYGKFASGDESLPTRPISPYGVTKLAAEQLCGAYAEAFGIPVVVLRYFSVYGPRQRPDMGYQRFIKALATKKPITVYGDGHQVRGNTYVSDCVVATIAALQAPIREIYNIGGSEMVNVWDIIVRLKAISGIEPEIIQVDERPGDQRHTFADCGKAARHLNWQPRVTLEEGLSKHWQWHAKNSIVHD
ncbi:MAG: GDP-mannose 4,6-dehydratase [Gemmatales bacterium]